MVLKENSFHQPSNLIEYRTEEPPVALIASLFNHLFESAESTTLVPGFDEPVYLPASETKGLSEIRSTRDYFRSALHEISHWCIAGKERRQLVDFGYWYEPDGRSVAQQELFEKVEIKPQALEWVLTEACGVKFSLSVDNLDNPDAQASPEFLKNVVKQAKYYTINGLPPRAQLFLNALLNEFNTHIDPNLFSLNTLK